jgi:hypothetical protein
MLEAPEILARRTVIEMVKSTLVSAAGIHVTEVPIKFPILGAGCKSSALSMPV